MIYCFEKNVAFDYTKSEMEICKENSNGILFDSDKNIFTDFSGNVIDITGLTIFPRTGVLQLRHLLEEIKRQGGIPNISEEETARLERWPSYYQTKRKMRVLKGKDLQDLNTLAELESVFGTEVFIKTVKKGFSDVIPTALLKDKDCVFYKALTHHLDEEFIVSEKVDLKEDRYGKKEYRCFVINNEPYNISRFTDEVLHEIDEEVLKALHEVIEKAKQSLPSTYAVDLLEYEKDGKTHIDVSEFNPPQASGLYLYNSILEPSSDILHHKNIKQVAKEFEMLGSEQVMEGSVINARTNLYEIPRSFSNDIRSIFLIGDIGVTFAADIPMTSSSYKSHKPVLGFSPFSEEETPHPMSDFDLLGNTEEKPKVYEKIETIED